MQNSRSRGNGASDDQAVSNCDSIVLLQVGSWSEMSDRMSLAPGNGAKAKDLREPTLS
jgi:hypothetical protein